MRKSLAANARAAKTAATKKKEADKEERKRHRLSEREKVVDLVRRGREMNANLLLAERNEDGTEAVAE